MKKTTTTISPTNNPPTFWRALFCWHNWEFIGRLETFIKGNKLPAHVFLRWSCTKCNKFFRKEI